MKEEASSLPQKLEYRRGALGGKIAYAKEIWRLLNASIGPITLVFCAHIRLLPFATLLSRYHRAPLVLMIYGIDVFTPSPQFLVRRALRHVTACIAMSDFTTERFAQWAGHYKTFIIPDSVDMTRFSPGPRPSALEARYEVSGKQVIMSLGRMAASERYKGFDEVLEVLPSLLAGNPNVVYMLVGDGDDRSRLQNKAVALGLNEHVRFVGRIPEDEKVEHYRLADAFVMPSRLEGFGFVFVEAMACGIPVVGSKIDGSREALQFGTLGTLVNPDDPESIRRGIEKALASRRGVVPRGLENFSAERFAERVEQMLEALQSEGSYMLSERVPA
jgi:glycosyltransferase involved in cell wall biosynthesis